MSIETTTIPAPTTAPTAPNLPAVVPPPAAPPAPTPKAPAPPVSFDADDPVALYMDSGVFGQLQRVAKLMSSSGLVPGYLQGEAKGADCFLVAAQAFRWRMDPFAVAQHTFVLKGKLGYEGKLIAAVVNSHRRIQDRLSYEYSGAGKDRQVIVSGKIKGEDAPRTVSGKVENWATDNEQWKKDPDQMLAYRGARQWARRHMPEAMIGIQAEEEVRETVSMERGADGSFVAAPAGLVALTAKLVATAADAPVAPLVPEEKQAPLAGPCSHPDIPPSRVAALPAGKSLVCSTCSEELSNPAAVPREVGEDDDVPAPSTAAPKPTAVPTKPRQGRLQE